MTGMSTFLYTLGLVAAMGVVYVGGMAGWVGAAFMLLAGHHRYRGKCVWNSGRGITSSRLNGFGEKSAHRVSC
jgi:hypothetical protein